MSSFAMVLLEDGVEMEIPTDLSSIISFLHREVPKFSFQGHGYALAPGKAKLGSRWDMVVESIDYDREGLPLTPVGRIVLEKLDDEFVQFRVPPRVEQKSPDILNSDPDGRFFGSFIFQTLNAMGRHKLIDLPGVLPTA
jgi:hypothetical protein